MSIVSRGFVTANSSSHQTGREAAADIARGFAGGPAPRVLVAFMSVNHDQPQFLRGLREVMGPDVDIVGCSTQGVIGRGTAREEGYAAAVMGLGGDTVDVAAASIEDIAVDTRGRGQALGRSLRGKLVGPPRVALLFFDPLCGADADQLLQGVHDEVGCAVMGGGAAHAFNYVGLQKTYQYFGDRVLSGAAVAVALAGEFTAEMEICHGCSPLGVELTVTRADKNVVLELDGRRATSVWFDMAGAGAGVQTAGVVSTLAVGIHGGDRAASAHDYLVRAAYSFDTDRGGLIMPSAIPAGTRIMLHHRTAEDVLDGARRMAQSLRRRLAGKSVRAVLGFECGARTRPFLGEDDTLKENLMLQREIGPDAAWIGAMFWGELFPVAGQPTFHNYSYPILALAD